MFVHLIVEKNKMNPLFYIQELTTDGRLVSFQLILASILKKFSRYLDYCRWNHLKDFEIFPSQLPNVWRELCGPQLDQVVLVQHSCVWNSAYHNQKYDWHWCKWKFIMYTWMLSWYIQYFTTNPWGCICPLTFLYVMKAVVIKITNVIWMHTFPSFADLDLSSEYT